MYYSLIKKLIFRFDPETMHAYTVKLLQWAHRVGLTRLIAPVPTVPCETLGLLFPNPIGLAAGFDKNGDCIDALAKLGFGFIEIGTVTPLPQEGNPTPRVFRLPTQEALINRLGFNNKGVGYVVEKLRQMQFKGVLGVNIGKNKSTPLEDAAADYLHVFRCVARYVSYVTINVSSPNTESLRHLQQHVWLQPLLRALKQEQALINDLHQKYVPIVVKIAPDLSRDEIEAVATLLIEEKIDGVIASNTTVSRDAVQGVDVAEEVGGLSGKPLQQQTPIIVKQLATLCQGRVTIIACGGITDIEDVKKNLDAGASLVQLYTGLVYHGPSLPFQLVSELARA